MYTSCFLKVWSCWIWLVLVRFYTQPTGSAPVMPSRLWVLRLTSQPRRACKSSRDQHLPVVEAGDLIIVPGTNAASRASPVRTYPSGSASPLARGPYCCGVFRRLPTGTRGPAQWEAINDALVTLTHVGSEIPPYMTQESALFVEDDGVITSAGIASGIDMALWIVERDHGPLVAAKVARELVIYMRRDADHGQLSVFLDYRSHLNPAVHRAQDFLVANFATTITLPALAAVAGTSGRHLARSFKSVTGLTPAAYQRKLRLDFAKTLLNDTELSIEVVALRAGFADGRSLRRLWHLEFGSSPSSHRLAARISQARNRLAQCVRDEAQRVLLAKVPELGR